MRFLVHQQTASAIPLLSAPLSVVGLFDDRHNLSSKWRYFAQLLTAALLLVISPLVHVFISVVQAGNWFFLILLAVLVIAITAVINFINFMDGLDGLVAGCMAVTFAALALEISSAPLPLWALVGSLLGFLIWNWSPAKVFMGDIGSTFLGAVFAGLVLQASSWSQAFSFLLIATPLLGDACICVPRRFFAGQHVFQAHRLHLFQRLHQAGWSHARVTLTYIIATSVLALAMLTGGWLWVFWLAVLELNWGMARPTRGGALRCGLGEVISFSFPIKNLIGLPPFLRRLLLIACDALLLPLAVWLSFWLRLASPFHPNFIAAGSWLLLASLLVGLPLYAFTGQYKGLTRYVGSGALYRLAGRNGLLVFLLAAIGLLLGLPMPPRSSWVLLWVLLTGFTGAVRFALRDLVLNLRSTQHKQQLRVAIYGAGEAGAQLAAALRLAGNYRIITFLDDDPAYWGRSIQGVPIQSPQVIKELKDTVDQVFLAIPSLSRSQRRRIVDDLQRFGISVLQVPSVDDLTSGRARIDSLRPIAIEDLLGRDEVPADPQS